MRLRLLPTIERVSLDYAHVDRCPLCGGTGREQAALTRREYRFSTLAIPLPAEPVRLMACRTCDLLYKDRVPTPAGLTDVMERAAEDEWNAKPGRHPSLEQVLPYLQGGDIIDIGASQGDLLRAVEPSAARRSAFDVVTYRRCANAVTGEYVIGTFERVPDWSGVPYDVVTAYDVFEHFLDAKAAVDNIVAFLRPSGHLLIETGDWRAVRDLAGWYYCNLFEHQIFWSARAIEYLCTATALELVRCERVNHKSRRDLPSGKRAAIRAFRAAGFALGPITGIDAALVPPVAPNDHLFAVLQKRAEAA